MLQMKLISQNFVFNGTIVAINRNSIYLSNINIQIAPFKGFYTPSF